MSCTVLAVPNFLALKWSISRYRFYIANLLINLVGNNNNVSANEAAKGCLTHRVTDKRVLINRGLLPWRRMKAYVMGGACDSNG
jgi:hypothetical protein